MAGGANEAGPCSREPLANGFRRPTRHRGQLDRVESVQIPQDQKRTIIRLEGALEQVSQREQLEIVPLARLRTWDETFERGSETAASAQRGEGAVAGDAKQPRLAIFDLAELTTATEGFIEAVLKQILGKRPIPDHLGEEPPEPYFAPVEELLDGLGVQSGGRFRTADGRHRVVPAG